MRTYPKSIPFTPLICKGNSTPNPSARRVLLQRLLPPRRRKKNPTIFNVSSLRGSRVRMPFCFSRCIIHYPSQMLKLTPFSSLSSLLAVSMLAFQADLDSPVVVTDTFWRARSSRFVLRLEIILYRLLTFTNSSTSGSSGQANRSTRTTHKCYLLHDPSDLPFDLSLSIHKIMRTRRTYEKSLVL